MIEQSVLDHEMYEQSSRFNETFPEVSVSVKIPIEFVDCRASSYVAIGSSTIKSKISSMKAAEKLPWVEATTHRTKGF